eukprot:SAG31_NODE_30208_length_384_cov_0.831579_1_plen_39_part_10
MASRIKAVPGGAAGFTKLLDAFFGYEPDGTVKPPVTQLG